MNAHTHRTANVWVARIIPLVLIGIVAYATWVIVALVCVDYLLRPPPNAPRGSRPGTAIVILVVYFILLLAMSLTYLRLLQTVFTNPGLVPRGPQWYLQHAQSSPRRQEKMMNGAGLATVKEKKHTTSTGYSGVQANGYSEFANGLTAESRQETVPTTASMEEFYTKDVFVCEADAKPRWCSVCLNWKPDRAHHCSEIGRCVRKMDHFCPWVGGIVSETSFKFFLQFNSYTAVFCLNILVFLGIFISEMNRDSQEFNVHWYITIALAALFELFTIGMTGSSVQLTLINSTTVENLTRKVKVWQLAVHVPNSVHGRQHGRGLMPPTNDNGPMQDLAPSRTFAMLSTLPGENPWDLGAYGNWKSVMGESIVDWFLPIKRSPCSKHDAVESAFALGPVVDRLRREHGLVPDDDGDDGDAAEQGDRTGQRRRRRRKTRADSQLGDKRAATDGMAESSDEKREARQKKRRRRREDGN